MGVTRGIKERDGDRVLLDLVAVGIGDIGRVDIPHGCGSIEHPGERERGGGLRRVLQRDGGINQLLGRGRVAGGEFFLRRVVDQETVAVDLEGAAVEERHRGGVARRLGDELAVG